MIRFELPVSVILPRVRVADKKVMLNMNTNWNRFKYNECKKIFKPISIPEEHFKAKSIIIRYRVEKKTKAIFDSMNYVSYVDKFFLDWLVKEKYLPDDTFNNVSYGSITGLNQCAVDRVIAEIEVKE